MAMTKNSTLDQDSQPTQLELIPRTPKETETLTQLHRDTLGWGPRSAYQVMKATARARTRTPLPLQQPLQNRRHVTPRRSLPASAEALLSRVHPPGSDQP